MTPIRKLLFSLFLIGTFCAQATNQFYTQSLTPQIKTLRIVDVEDGTSLMRPVLTLGDEGRLEISFDELSHDPHYYSYTLVHCNADWTPSDLQSLEYLQGFTSLDVQDFQQSVNTTQIYTHYRFEIPNDDMQLKLSGNYAVVVYEDGDKDRVVATACFSVVEPMATINARDHANTMLEIKGRYQQVDVDVTVNQASSQLAAETKLVVRQNNRLDNMAYDVKPTYVGGNQLLYSNTRALVFEGGNEYRRFDLSSLYLLGPGVERIDYDHTYYHALLTPSVLKGVQPYTGDDDVHGQFLINAERVMDDDVEADYVWVHFFLSQDAPYFDGKMYVGGEFTHNMLNASNQLMYDNDQRGYVYSALLKQGGYNYQYWFVPKGRTAATLFSTEGSYWQTRNEYSIYLYYRPFGQRYDRLIGYKSLLSHP